MTRRENSVIGTVKVGLYEENILRLSQGVEGGLVYVTLKMSTVGRDKSLTGLGPGSCESDVRVSLGLLLPPSKVDDRSYNSGRVSCVILVLRGLEVGGSVER